MSTFHTPRHGAPRARAAASRIGAGVLAATALGLGASTALAGSASANGGPQAPTTQSSTAGGAQSSDSTSSSSSFTDIVRVGDTGGVVEQIQDEVGVSADGVFGSETEQAVTQWRPSTAWPPTASWARRPAPRWA